MTLDQPDHHAGHDDHGEHDDHDEHDHHAGHDDHDGHGEPVDHNEHDEHDELDEHNDHDEHGEPVDHADRHGDHVDQGTLGTWEVKEEGGSCNLDGGVWFGLVFLYCDKSQWSR